MSIQDTAYAFNQAPNNGHAQNHTFAAGNRPYIVSLTNAGGALVANRIYEIRTLNTSSGNLELFNLDGTKVGAGWSIVTLANRGADWQVIKSSLAIWNVNGSAPSALSLSAVSPTINQTPSSLGAFMPPKIQPLNVLVSPQTAPVPVVNALPSPQVAFTPLTLLPSPNSAPSLTTTPSPMLGEFPTILQTRELILFDHILDQISSMLGADQWEDLPPIDQERVKIVVNQAYRECYAPIDGRRPRWASQKMTIKFNELQESAELPMDVIDIEKLPELVGHGPLSPMNAGTDQISLRSHFSGDFRPLPGYKGNYRSMDIDDPEIDQPVWYFIDQSDDGDGYQVIPRLFLYPIPDKEYFVNLVANMLPEGMNIGDSPRLPAEIVWDVLFPIAQYKLLTDPRYNGDNRELIMMQSKEAKRKLRSFASPQKHKTVRIRTRRGW